VECGWHLSKKFNKPWGVTNTGIANTYGHGENASRIANRWAWVKCDGLSGLRDDDDDDDC